MSCRWDLDERLVAVRWVLSFNDDNLDDAFMKSSVV